jgi:microcystin-dependent protein/outer membrane murein-binding lipoprotein Lpp
MAIEYTSTQKPITDLSNYAQDIPSILGVSGSNKAAILSTSVLFGLQKSVTTNTNDIASNNTKITDLNSELTSDVAALRAEIAALKAEAIPVGLIRMWTNTGLPTGWLVCDGSKYPIDGEYSGLYNIIGHSFDKSFNEGTNETSSSYFRVPDFRGVFPTGFDNKGNSALSDYNKIGNIGGKLSNILTASNIPLLTLVRKLYLKYVGDGGARKNIVSADSNRDGMSSDPTELTNLTVGRSTPNSIENRPPYLAVNFIIKAK